MMRPMEDEVAAILNDRRRDARRLQLERRSLRARKEATAQAEPTTDQPKGIFFRLNSLRRRAQLLIRA